MVKISSHILDAVHGCSASGIRVSCHRLSKDQKAEQVFEVKANEEGRIVEEIDFISSGENSFELVFYSDEYFREKLGESYGGRQIVSEVVIRLVFPDPEIRYHVPVIIGPHSNTFWWSE